MDNNILLLGLAVGLLSLMLFPITKNLKNHRIPVIRAFGAGSIAMIIVGTVSAVFLDIEHGRTLVGMAAGYLVGAALRHLSGAGDSPQRVKTPETNLP